MEAIYDVCPGVVIIPSTGGAVGMSAEERLQPTELRPSIATLDCGTVNFGDEVFVNTIPMLKIFGETLTKRNIKPECECFEKGHVDTALMLAQQGYISSERMHFNFVLGVPGAMPARVRELVFLVDSIPPDATWCATGIGRAQFPIAAAAIVMGGNVRVGFEDNLYYAKGRLAKSNGELVEKVVQISAMIGRGIASSNEAKHILGLRS
jgi:3-keto-5-aminohexanoate cleavage enzyme